MQKVDLKKVLDMLVNEEQESAEGLLHQWFVEKTKSIHESLMQEDDDVLENDSLTKSIEDDQDDIESEEYFGEADLDGASGDEEVDSDAADAVDDVESGDALDTDDTEDHQVYGDADDMSTDPEEIQNQFADLQSDLARLKAEFTKIVKSPTAPPADDTSDLDSSSDADDNMSPVGAMGTESVEEFDDLEEAFKLEPVGSAGLNTPRYSGDGGKVQTHNKSPIPQNSPDKRVGGKAVEIRAQEHTGVDRQEAPKVKQPPLRKNQVKNGAEALEQVGSLGPKDALLNRGKEIYPDKKDGESLMGSKKTTGLRGDFMKRK